MGPHHTTPQSTPKNLQSGSILIEMTVALGLLTAIGMFLLIGSLDMMPPRNWVIIQNITDAHLTYEEAYAKRVPFEKITDTGSDWPLYPAKSSQEIELGKAPGGIPIKGTIIRTRIPDENNLPDDPSDASYAAKLIKNPAEMETYKLQSVLTFKIGSQDYYKSRTVIRTR